jgi:cyanophycinase
VSRNGLIALVGSGEYLDVMRDVDRELIDGQPPVTVQIATAAVPDGEKRLQYWRDLGRRYGESVGLEVRDATVHDRDGANDQRWDEVLRGVGLIYLSGGNPAFLASTLRDTVLWRAIEREWRAGASLAGCSAGAMALCGRVPVLRGGGELIDGCGVLPKVRVIPHFDVFRDRYPQMMRESLAHLDAETTVIGIDEETALIGRLGDEWHVAGHGMVTVVGDDHVIEPGGTLRLPI